ncbi:MAG TPA: type 1 glutamine amidotransferase [Smithella sp.]|nr:gamma-glutamyl-gamma-aminobutyrate hydrolase family protein [Smithella sp.]HNY49753.1 type 1 glutamine amidotransferase [Smithella sp.]HOG90908.1 type 1 glutamine amidotransferase [Smithella sp.]HQG65523.1 type 1 glutamine amidotransferase [Smithella sp.]HQH16600.1 type 1 glutamine amidotransferase [Smithella sp.]
MRAHYLQHVPFEGLGSIESWLKKSGYEITSTKLFDGPDFPDLRKIDFLIVMGGPMSVNDEDKLPWLAAEKKFIWDTIAKNKPVLGICLGAQLIANVLGASVYPNKAKEIGWFSIHGIVTNDKSIFEMPASLKVFQWHGETFDLPAGAVRLAKSDVCENQAFQIGTSVIGLQFHLETTPEAARALVSNCGDDLVEAPYIQTDQEIMSAGTETFQSINHLMDEVLSFLGNNKSL